MESKKNFKVCLCTCALFYLIGLIQSFPAGPSESGGSAAADALPGALAEAGGKGALAEAGGKGDVQVRRFTGPTETHKYRVTGAPNVHKFREGGPPGGRPNGGPGPGGRPGGAGPRGPMGGKIPNPKLPKVKKGDSGSKGKGDGGSIPECKDRVTSHEGIVEVVLTGAKNVAVGAGTFVRKVLDKLNLVGEYPEHIQKAIAIAVCEGIKGGRDAESIVGQATGLLLNDVGKLISFDKSGPKDLLEGTESVLKDVGLGLGYIFKDAGLGVAGLFKELALGK